MYIVLSLIFNYSYFDTNRHYSKINFRNHFRMHRRVFFYHSYKTLISRDPNFQWKFNVAYQCGIHREVKLTVYLC